MAAHRQEVVFRLEELVVGPNLAALEHEGILQSLHLPFGFGLDREDDGCRVLVTLLSLALDIDSVDLEELLLDPVVQPLVHLPHLGR